MALSNITALRKLSLWGNSIVNIQPLGALVNLELLWLSDNAITDIKPLVDNAGLGTGDEVDIRRNPLDLTPGSATMKNINTLIARGVNLKYGSVKTLESLMDAPSLTHDIGRSLSLGRVD